MKKYSPDILQVIINSAEGLRFKDIKQIMNIYNMIYDKPEISTNTLSDTLKSLQDEGLIKKIDKKYVSATNNNDMLKTEPEELKNNLCKYILHECPALQSYILKSGTRNALSIISIQIGNTLEKMLKNMNATMVFTELIQSSSFHSMNEINLQLLTGLIEQLSINKPAKATEIKEYYTERYDIKNALNKLTELRVIKQENEAISLTDIGKDAIIRIKQYYKALGLPENLIENNYSPLITKELKEDKIKQLIKQYKNPQEEIIQKASKRL